jgi:hypothetical protein
MWDAARRFETSSRLATRRETEFSQRTVVKPGKSPQ